MTKPNHDVELDEQLRAALQRRADELSYAPGLAEGAVSRARTIRRRQRVAAAAAAVAAVVVLVR